MIKKWFIGLFIIFLGFGFFYQKKYLENLKEQAKTQSKTNSSNGNLVLAEGTGFKTFFYNENGTLKASLSGDKVVYYQNSSFLAEGNLVYQTYNALLEPTATIHTEKGIGEFDVSKEKNAFLFSDSRQLKWLKLPENVSFNFDGNQGTTKNVFIDAQKRTISSKEHIRSKGPQGFISADGFFYDIDKKEFQLNSNVHGTYTPPKQDLK